MTNYLYIPLGGNRKGELKTLRNLFIVFFASGIWHGAGWNFVIWGILHGICILIHRIWKNIGRKLPKLIGWFITINLVNIFWVFFRARDLQSAVKVLKGMIDVKSSAYLLKDPLFIIQTIIKLSKIKKEMLEGIGYKEMILVLIISILLVFLSKNSHEKIKKFTLSVCFNLEIVFYIIISICSLTGISTFLYFNF